MGDELKPCPFCGGEAELWHNAHWDYVVRCTKCGAKTRQHHENGAGAAMDWDKREGYRIVDNAFQSAISKWAHADAENRELRELIGDMHGLLQHICERRDECGRECELWPDHNKQCELRDTEDRMAVLGIEVQE